MAIKIIDNISVVQVVPAVSAEIVRDISKPLSFYIVGAGTAPTWSATVTFYEIDNVGYKKTGKSVSFAVSNTNPAELYTWTSSVTSFVAHVSAVSNASVTVYMTQAHHSSLERILLTEPSSGTKAMPSDVVNCTAEYVPGQGWVGGLGILDSYAVLSGLPTNALVPGKVWALIASASSFAKYTFMSAGWVLESSIGATGASNIPGSPSNPFASLTDPVTGLYAWATANLASLLPGRTTVWGPGNVEYVWAGPGAGDWGVVVSTGFPENENTLFDFSGISDDSPVPSSDTFGKPIALFTNPAGVQTEIRGGAITKTQAVVGSVYMDTVKHVNDISEAGCTFQLRDSGQVAICLWKDYTSIDFPQGKLQTACHLVIGNSIVHLDFWDNGAYISNVGVGVVSIPMNTTTSLAVKFSGSRASVYVNGVISFIAEDPRIRTLGRKVGCFEMYVANNVLGPKIISGYTKSDEISRIRSGELDSTTLPVFISAAPSALTITGSFTQIIPNITVSQSGNYLLNVSVPIVQTVTGEVYVRALVTHANASTNEYITAISIDVGGSLRTAMLRIGALVNGDTVAISVAKSGGAAATIPAPSGYNRITAKLEAIN